MPARRCAACTQACCLIAATSRKRTNSARKHIQPKSSPQRQQHAMRSFVSRSSLHPCKHPHCCCCLESRTPPLVRQAANGVNSRNPNEPSPSLPPSRASTRGRRQQRRCAVCKHCGQDKNGKSTEQSQATKKATIVEARHKCPGGRSRPKRCVQKRPVWPSRRP